MNDLICLHSRDRLTQARDTADALIAPSGSMSYPMLGSVPVLVRNPSLYLSEMYYQYGSWCHSQDLAAGRLATPFQGLAYRRSAAACLREGMTANTALLRSMIRSIEPHFTKSQLLDVAVANQFPPVEQVKAFQYLKRDWCGLPEDESNLAIITAAISAVLHDARKASGHAPVNALFLGAGAGRLACDLSTHFGHTYATDLSLPMAWLFNRIMSGDNINFFDISLSHILRNEHTARKMQASARAAGITEERLDTLRSDLTYFISDACSLPVRSDSMDCIVSVYFTDVVPFPKVFPEINRVLKKGGLFIHFGPFANNFSSFQAMFSGEDIRSYLSGHGYICVLEDQVHTEHMKSPGRIATQTYENWLFAARKIAPSLDSIGNSITDDTVLDLASPLNVSVSGAMGPSGGGFDGWRYSLFNTYKGTTYDDAEEVIRLLKLIDGQRTLSEVMDHYGNGASAAPPAADQVHRLVRFLIREGVLTVKDSPL